MAVVLTVENNNLFELIRIRRQIAAATILNNVNVSVNSGDFLTILGASGAGKTTLLRLFNGLDSPTSGSINYRGKPVSDWNMSNLRRQVGMVFQEPVIIPGSVRDNLLLNQRWDKDSPVVSDLDLLGTLEKAGLQAIALDGEARSLSSGEKQRLALARVLLNRPQVLLLDEPTANLDPGLARQVIRMVAELHREMHLTVIIVSHNPDLIRRYATRVVFIDKGKILEDGSGDILDSPATGEFAEYLAEEH